MNQAYDLGGISERGPDWLLRLAAGLFMIIPPVYATDFGGNLAWSQYVAGLAIVLACILVALAQVWSVSHHWFSGTHAPAQPKLPAFALTGLLLLLLCFTYFQTIELSPDLVKSISPASHHARYEWAAALTPDAVAEKFPISVAPFDSAHANALLVIAILVSYFSPFAFYDRSRTTWLLAAIAACGCSIAAIGILRKIDTDFLMWSFLSGGEGAPFGTYLNRNNAAFAINTGIAAALGVLVWRKTITASIRKNAEAIETPRKDAMQWLSDWPLVLALAATTILLLGIVACGSRGGLLTTFIAGGLTLAVVRRSIGSLRGVILVIAAFGGLAFLILRTDSLGYQSLEGDAFAELRDTVDGDGRGMSNDARLTHWPDGLRAATNYLPAGSGLGTYGYAYLPWQKTSSWRWFVHADNLWLEGFLELGLFGVALFAGCIGLLGRSLWRLSRSADPIDQGLLATGSYLFVATLFSQTFDFGLIMPANLVMVMMLLPMIFVRSAAVLMPKVATSGDSQTTRKLELLTDGGPAWHSFTALEQRVFPLAMIVCLAALTVPAIMRLRQDCEIDGAVRLANKELPGLRLDSTRLQERVVALEALAKRTPNPQLSDLLARYRFQLGRLREFQSLRATTRWAESADELYAHLSFQDRRLAWRAAAFEHRKELEATGVQWPAIDVSEAAVSESSDYAKSLQWSIDSLRQCPLSPRPRDDQLRLEFVHRSSTQTQTAIVQGANLFPNNAELSYRFGRRAAAHGDYDTAASLWRRAAEVHPPLIKRILPRAVALNEFPIASMVPNNPLTRKTVQDYLRQRGLEAALNRPSHQ